MWAIWLFYHIKCFSLDSYNCTFAEVVEEAWDHSIWECKMRFAYCGPVSEQPWCSPDSFRYRALYLLLNSFPSVKTFFSKILRAEASCSEFHCLSWILDWFLWILRWYYNDRSLQLILMLWNPSFFHPFWQIIYVSGFHSFLAFT